MPKKKLNLLQFTACGAAKPSAASTEIVRGEFAYANLTGELLDDVPDQLLRDSLTPNLAVQSLSRPITQSGTGTVRT